MSIVGTILRRTEPVGPIECEWGPFDGSQHEWPLTKSDIIVSRPMGGEQISCIYRDTGRTKPWGIDLSKVKEEFREAFAEAAVKCRIFRADMEATVTPPPFDTGEIT